MRGRMLTGALVLMAGADLARAEMICGHEIKLKSLIMERQSKWFAGDKRDKKALGSFIAECEADGVRYIVSSPDGKADNPHISGFIYRPKTGP